MKPESIGAAIIALVRMEGRELNAADRLTLRTRIAVALEAKERHRQRMSAAPYQWTRKTPPRY